MDPLSISMACITLADIMFKATKAAASFVCNMRSAQADIDAMNCEFNSIIAMINLLTEDFLKWTPEQLQAKISAVVVNCVTITGEIHRVLSQYQIPSSRADLHWALSGKKELEKLRSNLNTHRNALDIALDTVKLVVISGVKEDTIEIRRVLQDEVAQISQKVRRIERRIFNDGDNSMLRQWLDDISCYTSCCAGSVITSVGPNTAELRRRYGIQPEPASRTQWLVDGRFVTSQALRPETLSRPNGDGPITGALGTMIHPRSVNNEIISRALPNSYIKPPPKRRNGEVYFRNFLNDFGSNPMITHR
ncbi:hypothetical protein F5Y13DRAFT_186387 [Hypoxylon sp. FL1857]|nr:hypothetical protein F5Y13DRAFT_186387 [Hypoxylon sp. FL1857]